MWLSKLYKFINQSRPEEKIIYFNLQEQNNLSASEYCCSKLSQQGKHKSDKIRKFCEREVKIYSGTSHT